jgi:uncharacterized membrane protein YuzA (DUF378 family)
MGSGNGLYGTAIVLLIIGGLNWGLVGLFNFDLVAAIFGQLAFVSRLVYILVGLSAVYVAIAEPARIAEHRQMHMAHR